MHINNKIEWNIENQNCIQPLYLNYTIIKLNYIVKSADRAVTQNFPNSRFGLYFSFKIKFITCRLRISFQMGRVFPEKMADNKYFLQGSKLNDNSETCTLIVCVIYIIYLHNLYKYYLKPKKIRVRKILDNRLMDICPHSEILK